MNYYHIIDILLIAIVGYATYYYYQKRIYLKLFEYFKIFFLISLSAKLAPFTGTYLQKFYITATDTHSITVLIGFGVNFAILFYGYKYIFKLLNNIINSQKARSLLAQVTTFIEVSVIITFLLFMSMQLHPSKVYVMPTLQKTMIYPHIKNFYIKFLNDKFIYMILNNDSPMDTKEVIFKSLKSSVE